MAMDFPNSPTVNQTYTVGDKTWKWSGTAWEIVVNRPAMRTVADTPPASPIVGDEWFNSLTGRTYTWFDSYWVEVNTNSIVGASGIVSVTAPITNSGTSTAAALSIQSNPSFSGTTTLNTGNTSEVPLINQQSPTAGAAHMVSRGAGYLGWIGQRTDTTRRFAFEANPSEDSGANFGLYLYNSTGGSTKQVFGTTYANGALTLPNQPVWNSDITSTTNGYSTFSSNINIGFTQTNSSTITVQTAGSYYVKAQQLMQTNGGGYWQLQKNNSTFKHGYVSTTSFYDVSVGALIYMYAGDTLRIYTAISLSNSWNGAHSSLDIMKVA
jgi:hypothetical protein